MQLDEVRSAPWSTAEHVEYGSDSSAYYLRRETIRQEIRREHPFKIPVFGLCAAVTEYHTGISF